MERTTKKQLQTLLRQLAAVTDTPMESWTRRPDGSNCAIIGALVLDSHRPDRTRLYRVEQISSEGGAVCTPFGDRRFTAGELYEALRMAIGAVRLVLGEDEFHTRMRRAYPQPSAQAAAQA